jgi:hypothetical protein
MKHIHSLPEPRELGFRWRPFEKARKKLERVEGKRREVQRREAELKARIESEEQEDVKRLAAAILSGSGESAPPELEDLAAKMKELNRLSEALKAAEPQAESELIRTVREHRDQWIPEVDAAAVVRALEEEREAFDKALQLADSARSKRQRLEQLATWVRTTPPSFSPPADVSVRSAFDRLRAEIEQAEHLLRERAANERIAAQEAARLEREAREGAA